MVRRVRQGVSLRTVAGMYGVSRETVTKWVRRAGEKELDEVCFDDGRKSRGMTHNRTPAKVEQCVLATRIRLRDESVLGEFGAEAIHREMQEMQCPYLPPIRTINNILKRHGAFDYRRRVRQKSPPSAWYLPAVCAGEAEMDVCDFIEDLRIENTPDCVHVLNIASTHGSLVGSFVMPQMLTQNVLTSLLEHWKQHGLPRYAQFDNGMVFYGAPKPDCIGRVARMCLQLGVTPVFAPPREIGKQNKVEGYNDKWQKGIWRRFHFDDYDQLAAQSRLFVEAYNRKNARRIADAPPRTPLAADWQPDLSQPVSGKIIFLRRMNAIGVATVLEHPFFVTADYPFRLARCEVNLDANRIDFHLLRRRAPDDQPLLSTHEYHFPNR